MKFWDTSALVPLFLWEDGSQTVRAIYETDDDIVAWWATVVECESAIARRERESTHTAAEAALARERLDGLGSEWREIDPTPAMRPLAGRLLRVHLLRAADALQLAAAMTAAEGDPSLLELVCLDERLAAAAKREGFRVVPL